jgi:DNA replicative helicase MCM subunit Mcm2 (Cdc46/Mcm family)
LGSGRPPLPGAATALPSPSLTRPAPPCVPPRPRPAQKEKERCKEFLQSFRAPDFSKGGEGAARYLDMLASVAAQETERFQVDLDDVQMHEPALAVAIVQNTRRYADLFAAAIDELLPAPAREVGERSTIQDVLQTARLNRLDANPEAAAGAAAGQQLSSEELARFFPPKLLRRYEVRFTPRAEAAAKPLRLRDIGSPHIGKFVTAECIVIRASDVKPLIEVAVYSWCVPAQPHPTARPPLRLPAV